MFLGALRGCLIDKVEELFASYTHSLVEVKPCYGTARFKLKLDITMRAPNSLITRAIPIDIQIESHVFKRVYNYLVQNPKIIWVLS